MRKLIGLALIFLLCVLTACGGNSAGPSGAEDADGPDEGGLSSPAEDGEDPEGSGDWTVYDCGGLEIALPNEHLEQLVVETDLGSSGIEGYTPLVNIREKASVEAAERDFGTSEDVGILFGFVRLDQAAYDMFKEADGYGIDFFAQDGEVYYARTTPSNIQFYRGQTVDEDSEDWKDWETLLALGESVQEDMIRRNGLTEITK